ncbi:MAG: hypothetical protein ACRD3W_22900, partial [Terriglobales bacterium]
TAQSTIESEITDDEMTVYQLLSDEPISANDLGQSAGISAAELAVHLVNLEMAGLLRRVPGDRYIRSDPERNNPSNQNNRNDELERLIGTIAEFLHFVRTTFKGVSRKYLQKHLALFGSVCQPGRWTPASLLKSCLKHGMVRKDEILSYVSPAQVKIWI